MTTSAPTHIGSSNTPGGGCAQLGFIEKAGEVFASISLKGFIPDAMSWTLLTGGSAANISLFCSEWIELDVFLISTEKAFTFLS